MVNTSKIRIVRDTALYIPGAYTIQVVNDDAKDEQQNPGVAYVTFNLDSEGDYILGSSIGNQTITTRTCEGSDTQTQIEGTRSDYNAGPTGFGSIRAIYPLPNDCEGVPEIFIPADVACNSVYHPPHGIEFKNQVYSPCNHLDCSKPENFKACEEFDDSSYPVSVIYSSPSYIEYDPSGPVPRMNEDDAGYIGDHRYVAKHVINITTSSETTKDEKCEYSTDTYSGKARELNVPAAVQFPGLTVHIRKKLRDVWISVELEDDTGLGIANTGFWPQIEAVHGPFVRTYQVETEPFIREVTYPGVRECGTDYNQLHLRDCEYKQGISVSARMGYDCMTQGSCLNTLDFIEFRGWFGRTDPWTDNWVLVASTEQFELALNAAWCKYATSIYLNAVYRIRHVAGLLSTNNKQSLITATNDRGETCILTFDSYDNNGTCPEPEYICPPSASADE